jgi:hypothetical protein
MQAKTRVAFCFGPEIPDQNCPALPFQPLLHQKKGRLAWKIGPRARWQSTAPAARPAALGCDRWEGRSQSRPMRQADAAVVPLSNPAWHTRSHALTPRPGTLPRFVALRQTASGTSMSICGCVPA